LNKSLSIYLAGGSGEPALGADAGGGDDTRLLSAARDRLDFGFAPSRHKAMFF
jgi:hypothetical protein